MPGNSQMNCTMLNIRQRIMQELSHVYARKLPHHALPMRFGVCRLLTILTLFSFACGRDWHSPYDPANAFEKSWHMAQEYSSVNNPNGPWSYGRKWSPEDTGFDLMPEKWGETGWFFGNWGHGGPSLQTGVNLWARNNSNGLPVVRWTCPEKGTYHLVSTFRGADSRGVDVKVYIAVNNDIKFNSAIVNNQDSTRFESAKLNLATGSTIDFFMRWNGGVNALYSWTLVDAVISKY